MVPEIKFVVRGVCDVVVEDWHAGLSEGLHVGGHYEIFVICCAKDRHVFCKNILNNSFSFGTALITEPTKLSTTKITLKSSNMLGQLLLMISLILRSPINIASRFLPTPSYKPHSSLRFVTCLFQQPERLEHGDKSSAIVIGTRLGSRVPGIDMPTSKHNLIGESSTHNLEDQVMGIRMFNKLAHQGQINLDRLTTGLHTTEHLSILHCDRTTWDLSNRGIVLHIPSMHGVYTGRCNRTDQCCYGAVSCGDGGTFHSVRYRCMIIYPFIVEAYNPSFCFFFVCFQIVVIGHYEYLGHNWTVAGHGATETDDVKFGISWGQQPERFLSSHPLRKIRNRLKSYILKPNISGLLLHLINRPLQHNRAPHPRPISISQVRKPIPRRMFPGSLCYFHLEIVDDRSVISLTHCCYHQQQAYDGYFCH